MANNRIWLVHRPTGEAICLGKRMGIGWYTKNPAQGDDINGFFDRIEQLSSVDVQDDFVLVLEDADGAPCAYQGEWRYERLPDGSIRPRLPKP